ncbi:MAG: hypothetical protein Q4C99_00590 [Clostridia bacterium]|nr:hypothetical protein [Clostridia bacterium]
MKKRYESLATNSDVIMYSKAVLMRNLAHVPYPIKMSDDTKRTVVKKVFACIKNSPLAQEFDLINTSDISKAKALSYSEKDLISESFAKQNSSFLLSKNEDVCISINEEDHIKINSFASGQNIEEAYNKANDIDDIFINGLQIAFSDKYGFLASSPFNLGTGLNVSVVLHLPALASKGIMSKLSTTVSKLGFVLKEMYDGGAGDFYILTNTVTLGITEKNAIDNLNAVCNQIVAQERTAREALKENPSVEDKIYRTLGILKLARKLSVEEFLNSISLVRLGISLGYFEYSYELIGDMLYNLFDATLVNSSKSDLTQSMCETLRAQIVREKLA